MFRRMMTTFLGALGIVFMAVGLFWMIDQPATWTAPSRDRILICMLDGQVVVARRYTEGSFAYRLNQGWITITDEAHGTVTMKVDVCINQLVPADQGAKI